LAFAALIGATAFLTLTFALVSFFAGIFQPNPWAWCFGALIVTAIYFVAAVGMFALGRKELTQAGVAPTRTLRVLKEDQIWIQNEARTQV
jgi:divalent metal cation (Fe/Co/Zn/Cd) transporter